MIVRGLGFSTQNSLLFNDSYFKHTHSTTKDSCPLTYSTCLLQVNMFLRRIQGKTWCPLYWYELAVTNELKLNVLSFLKSDEEVTGCI